MLHAQLRHFWCRHRPGCLNPSLCKTRCARPGRQQTAWDIELNPPMIPVWPCYAFPLSSSIQIWWKHNPRIQVQVVCVGWFPHPWKSKCSICKVVPSDIVWPGRLSDDHKIEMQRAFPILSIGQWLGWVWRSVAWLGLILLTKGLLSGVSLFGPPSWILLVPDVEKIQVCRCHPGMGWVGCVCRRSNIHVRWHLRLSHEPIWHESQSVMRWSWNTSFPHSHGKCSGEFDFCVAWKIVKEWVTQPNSAATGWPLFPQPSLALVCFSCNCSFTGNLSSNAISHDVIS